MTCDGCGNPNAFGLRRAIGRGWTCNFCDELFSFASTFDVFFDGQSNPNLCDDLGRPVEFISKGQKSRWMKDRGVQEAGDLVHGARYSAAGPIARERRDCKEEVRQAVAKARETLYSRRA